MIQRIQSVYLAIAAIVTIVLLFIPIGYIYTADAQYVFTCFSVKLVPPATGVVMSTLWIAFGLIVSAVMSVVAIFMYKDRMKQVRLVSLNMLVFLIAVVLMVWLYPDVLFARKNIIGIEDYFKFNMWVMVFIFPPIGMFLANRAIRSDEKKVRAADRLR